MIQKDAILDELSSIISPARSEQLQIEFCKMFSTALPHLPLSYSPEVLVVKRSDRHYAAAREWWAELEQLEHVSVGQSLREQTFQRFQSFQPFKTSKTSGAIDHVQI